MPDLKFFEAFSDNPLTLSIMTVGLLFALLIWKGEWLVSRMTSRRDKVVDGIASDIKAMADKDAAQDAVIAGLSGKMDSVVHDMGETNRAVREMRFNLQRKTIHDERVPLADRVAAAIRYERGGGNSETGKFIKEKLRPENKELFSAMERLIAEEA